MTIRLAQAHNREQCGGKAMQLSAMINAGFPVKDGFVITTSEVESMLATERVAQFEATSALQFPVAVRSSAVEEDGAEHSWAGQFVTELNVSREGLEQAILACIKSRAGDAARSYASVHGDGSDIALALVVQEMVPAVCAGVFFTKDPTGRQVDRMIVEVVAGLGESLVSGRTSPRRYVLNAETGDIVSEEGSDAFRLTAEQCGDLARLGQRLRALFQAEQDVEWAIDVQGNVFITQSRAITVQHTADTGALAQAEASNLAEHLSKEQDRLASLGLTAVEGDILSDQNIAELITPHPCQMAFGLFTFLFAHGDGAIREGRNTMGYDVGSELDRGFFRLVAGQPRCSIVHDALTYRIQGIPLADYAKIVGYYLGRIKEDPQLGNYPEVVLYDQDPSEAFLTELFGRDKAEMYRRAYEQFFTRILNLEDTLDSEIRGRFLPHLQSRMRELSGAFNSAKNIRDLTELYAQTADLLRTEACRMFVLSARLGFFAFARLRNRLTEHFPGEADHYINILTSGIPVERNPNLGFSIRLAGLRDGLVTREAVIEEFGHLAMHELEISVPRYRDQPDLMDKLAYRIAGDPLVNLQESVRVAETLRDWIIRELSGESAVALEREIGVARTFLSLREVVKFEYLKGYDFLRRISVRISRGLGWDDNLIFHLDPREMFQLDPERMHDLACGRRAQHHDFSSIFVPAVIFSDDLAQIGKLPAPTGNILRGIGVTNTIAEGEVVVVSNPSDDEAFTRLRPGSILVTVTTDPAWSPMLSVIGRSGGLVTEVGGLLAHGAIYAREIGFAAVLNVPGATTTLRTGMRVRVVGPDGYVEILR